MISSEVANRSLRIVYSKLRVQNIILFSIIPLLLVDYTPFSNQFLRYLIMIFLFNIFIFTFNDYKDAPYDYQDMNKRRRNIFLCQYNKNIGYFCLVVPLIAYLIIGLFETPIIFFFNLVTVFLGYNYNAGIKAKNKPFLDIFFHGTWPVFILVLGILMLELQTNIEIAIVLTINFLIGVCSGLLQEYRDFNVDKLNREMTTVVFLGKNRSKLLIKIVCATITIITLFAAFNPLVWVLSLFAFLWMLFIDYEDYPMTRLSSYWYIVLLVVYIFV